MNERKIHSTHENPVEAILFGVVPHGDERTAPEALRELAELADTGEFIVSGCITQHRRHPDPNHYLGRGKIEELAEIIEQTKAGAVIADDPLSPAQGRNLEKALKVPVIDRSELILHIFDYHARTPQAKLQVELARLQYQLPRLKRMWTHLERQRGGIGLRGGAGEKQIDLDRSELRARIATVSKKLKEIENRKAREVSSRGERFSIALVGYTNAGKSTLMNRLTEAGVLEENRLFSTLDTRTRPWRLPGGRTVLLSDTVGFIRKLPHQLVASFHATLEEALSADLLFVVVEASNSEARTQLETVEEVLERLGAGHIPRLHLLNKVDQVEDRSLLVPLYAHSKSALPISARTGEGVDELQVQLQSFLAGYEQQVEVLIPHEAGKLHAEIRNMATVLSEFYSEAGCLMELRVSPTILGRILSQGAVFPDLPTQQELRRARDGS